MVNIVKTWGIGLLSTNRESTKRYFHFDALGSTVALTDSSEVVQDTYTFSAFGIQESFTGSSTNPFRFCGQWGYYDDGAMGSFYKMLLLGVRYYWPEYGRFLTWDPLPDANLYRYCKNAPTQCIDPNGRAAMVLAAPALVGAGPVGWFVLGVIAIGAGAIAIGTAIDKVRERNWESDDVDNPPRPVPIQPPPGDPCRAIYDDCVMVPPPLGLPWWESPCALCLARCRGAGGHWPWNDGLCDFTKWGKPKKGKPWRVTIG